METLAIIYEGLKSWQTGIGALLGFVALAWAATKNFNLNRQRDRELREEDGSSLLLTLYGEICYLRERLATVAAIISRVDFFGEHKKLDDRFRDDFMPPEPYVYERLVGKLGAIESSHLVKIVAFYTDYLDARANLRLVVAGREPRYIPTAFLEPASRAVLNIESTLRTIEFKAGLLPSKTPDLGHTAQVIDHWNRIAEDGEKISDEEEAEIQIKVDAQAADFAKIIVDATGNLNESVRTDYGQSK